MALSSSKTILPPRAASRPAEPPIQQRPSHRQAQSQARRRNPAPRNRLPLAASSGSSSCSLLPGTCSELTLPFPLDFSVHTFRLGTVSSPSPKRIIYAILIRPDLRNSFHPTYFSLLHDTSSLHIYHGYRRATSLRSCTYNIVINTPSITNLAPESAGPFIFRHIPFCMCAS